VIDLGKLEGACGRPYGLWAYGGEDDAVLLAASLLFGLGQAHAFLQGNKGTAFVGALLFLYLNGWKLSERADSAALAEAVVDLLRESLTERQFADLLRPNVEPCEL
jgi:death-on-curing protein